MQWSVDSTAYKQNKSQMMWLEVYTSTNLPSPICGASSRHILNQRIYKVTKHIIAYNIKPENCCR